MDHGASHDHQKKRQTINQFFFFYKKQCTVGFPPKTIKTKKKIVSRGPSFPCLATRTHDSRTGLKRAGWQLTMTTVQLESTYTSCAVTSLSVIAPGIVCGGMGRLLRVWKPKPSHHQQQQRGQGGADIGGGSGAAIASLETTLPVLPSTAVIHLIRPCREHEAEERQGGGGGGQVKVAVCGHKQVAVVTVTAAPSSLDVAVAWKLPELDDLVVEADWIRTALSSSSSTSVPDLALVYAHNLVELWPYMAAAPTRRVLATDRSLLYSAKLMPQLEASNFYIAAGTVFSEVREFDDHLMLFICKRLHWQHRCDSG